MTSVAAPLDSDCAMPGMRALEGHRIDGLAIVFPQELLLVNALPGAFIAKAVDEMQTKASIVSGRRCAYRGIPAGRVRTKLAGGSIR